MILQTWSDAFLSPADFVSQVFCKRPRHRRRDKVGMLLHEMLHLRNNKPAAFARSTSKLIDEPIFPRMQHSNIEVAPELIGNGIPVRMTHDRIGNVCRLPSRPMHACNHQRIFTEYYIGRKSPHAHQCAAPVSSKCIREEDRFKAGALSAFPRSHARRRRVAEVPRMGLNRIGIFSRKLAPIRRPNLRVVKRAQQVLKRIGPIRSCILRQVDQYVRAFGQLRAQLPCTAMIEVFRRDLDNGEAVPACKLRRTIHR